MVDSEYPKLIDRKTGATIVVNANPFSLGRSLVCNYVIVDKVISRTHCVLEKHDDQWIVVDSSMNGTYVDNKLVKAAKSDPLGDNSVISLDLNHYTYTFRLPGRNNENMDDISDEQLCLFADTVLNDVQAFQDDQQEDDSVIEINDSSIAPNHPLHDHVGMVKSQDRSSSKKLKIEAPPAEENLMVVDLADTSNPEESINDQAGPSTEVTEQPPDSTTEPAKAPQGDAQPPKEPPQDNFEVMENELQCAICSELFIKAVTLNCAHTFCKYCIDMWKKTKSECPICRAKITSMTATLVLDNVVEKVMESSPEELREHRKKMIEEREMEKKAAPAPAPPATNTGRGRSRRTRGGRGRSRQQGGATVIPNAGAVIQAVIELSSDSDEWDDESSNTDSGDTSEWRDEYDNDDWYDEGVPGAYYGGYGYCFSCGRPGHWANGCPYR